MASGRLGVSNPAANTPTLLYTVPSLRAASFNISVVNIGGMDGAVTIFISENATTDNARIIENGCMIPKSGGVLERGGLVASAGERVYITCTSPNFSVRVYGFED